MRRVIALLPAMLLVLAPVAASANPAPLALTGSLAAAVKQSATTPGIDADEMAAIVAAILGNGSGNVAEAVDPQEKALIEALGKQGATTVAVTLDGHPATIGPLQPEAGRFLHLVFVGTPNPGAILRSGNPEFLRHMARFFGLPNPMLRNQMLALMGQELRASWRNSTLGNNFEPLRQQIGTAVKAFDAASPATRKAGRALLYSSMVSIDRESSGSVPDFLYASLKD